MVVKVKRLYNGYGRHVIIRTASVRNAVRPHEQVPRAEGRSREAWAGHRSFGSTGTSTSSHLHYEVHKNGEKVNPAHYFFNDLTPEEYEAMIEASEVETQSLD